MKFIVFFFISFISLSIAAKSFSGNKFISGKILDKSTGRPIPMASIFIPDLKIGTLSDLNGHYILDKLPRGEYLIQVSALGYASITQVINLGQTTTVDFKLSHSNYELSDIVVTAFGNTTTRKRAPIPITVINQKMISESMANTAIDLISKEPGINATTEGSGTTKPQINGLGFNRVLTLMDGLPQEDFQWGDDHGILIDPYAVYEAEIIRGPASLQYGASAEAGVISFKSAPFPETGHIQGNIISEYHTNNGYLGTSLNLAGNRQGLVWRLQANGEIAHSFYNPKDGYVWGSAWNQTNFRLALGLNRNWGFTRLTLSALNRRIELPGGNRDSSSGRFLFNTPIGSKIYPDNSDFLSYRADIASDKILAEYQAWIQNSFNIGLGKIGLDFGYARSIHHDIDSGTVGSSNLILADIPFNVKYQLSSEKSGIKITAGINGLYEKHHNGNAPPSPYIANYSIPNYTNFELGAYAILEKNFKNLSLSGGIRFDRTHFIGQALSLENPATPQQIIVSPGTPGSEVQFSAFNTIYTGTSGSLGASYQLPSNQYLKINLAKSFRAPAINELTSNGLNIGSNLVELGNIHLKAESGYQLDFAYGFNGKNLSLEADGFYNQINHFIFSDRTDSLSGGYPIYQYVSSNTAIIKGISGVFNLHPQFAKWVELDNRITYIYSQIPNATDSTNHIPYIPAPHIHSDLKFRLKDKVHSILKSSYIKLGIEHDWAQNNIYKAFFTELPSAAYTLFNIGLGSEIVLPKTGKKICSVYLNCTNLGNIAYADHLNLAQYFLAYNGTPVTVTHQNQGIYNMGRNIGFKLIFPFF